MVFQISKVSDHGTSNPIVARLAFQTSELLKFCHIGEDKKIEVKHLFFNKIQPQLLTCDDIVQQITTEILEKVNELEKTGFNTQSYGRVIEVPYIINLENRLEHYLYCFKNGLRELSKLLNIFYGTSFNKARYDEIIKWSKVKFGDQNVLTQLLEQDHEQWIKKMIEMRNAVEHPGEKSGKLCIKNFTLLPKNHPDFPKVIEPSWHLNDNPVSSIAMDILTSTNNLLEFCEDLLILCIKDTRISNMLLVREIPENERNEILPFRYEFVLNKKLLPKESIE